MPFRVRATLLMLCLMWCLADTTSAAGETLEFPFQTETVTPDRLTQPVALLWFRARIGDPVKGERRVSIRIRAANGSDEDQKLTITLDLLDAEGAEVATRTEKFGIEDDEFGTFNMKFRLTEAAFASITRCRLGYSAQEE
jgi:hypothetical protein